MAHFDEKDLMLFEKLSHQAAIAIENARLYALVNIDSLTSLYIKRFFNSRLKEEFERAKRYKNAFGLILLDLDHFKKVNDTYGHVFGDSVLMAVGDCITEVCRSTDIPCRIGGDEFAIILTETDEKGTLSFCKRLNREVKALGLKHEGKNINLTISIGAIIYPDFKVENSKDLVRFADKALYTSKDNGRDQYNFYSKKKN